MAKEFDLLSKSYKEIKVLPAAAKVAGEFETYNETNGFHLVAISTAEVALAEERSLIVEAETVKIVKTTGETWVTGEAVAWVAGTSKVSNVIGTDILIGVVKEAAASADTIGYITFDGTLAYARST